MSTSVPIIITVPPTRPSTTNQSANWAPIDSIYDKARAIIAEAEANNTAIWFRDGTEEPQT